nr:uncharacterized protein LOC111419553 [Onthophagus taurus]
MFRYRSVLLKANITSDLPTEVIQNMLSKVEVEHFMTGDCIIKSGRIGTCMYFIVTGTVAIYTYFGVEMCHLYDGAHFGEMALLLEQRRVTTAIALEPCELCRLNKSDFYECLSRESGVFQKLVLGAKEGMKTVKVLNEMHRAELEKWTLMQIFYMELNLNKHNPTRASDYIDLPSQIKNGHEMDPGQSVLGRMKDEYPNRCLTSFVGTGTKAYSITLHGDNVKKAKGVKKYVIDKDLSVTEYKRVVECGGSIHKTLAINDHEKTKTANQAEKRIRGANFKPEEITLLLDLVADHKNVLENKNSHVST